MPFHRLTVPSYFGGLPGGYDYVNNAIAGTPAFADAVKGSGPNVGTYFVAFGEDGTSSDANRPAKALSENTDHLDDLLHRDIAVPTRTVDVTPGAPVASVLFGAGTYVGAAGTPNTPAGINTFVEILDANDNEIIIPATGQKCQVTSITGPAVGSGFSPGAVTFNISPSIPTGQTYRMYYAQRGNLATLPDDAFTSIKIRGAQEIPAAFEDFQKQIARISGSNVLALVASIIETPDGVRLAKSATQSFDVDPDGSVGGIRKFILRKARDVGGALTLLEVNDDPALGGAATGRLKMAAGTVQEFLGTGLFRDANVAAGAAQGGAFIPTTSNVGTKGDQYLRVFEYGTNTAGFVPSVFQHMNARWTCTVGDGSSSFGDFSGATALKDAIDFAIAKGWSNIHIKVKTGNYASATIAITTQTVILEGMDGTSYINAAIAGPTITVGSGALLLRGMTVQTFGAPYAIDATGSELLAFDHCRIEGTVHATNVTGTLWAEPIVAHRSTFLNSTGFACFEGTYNVNAHPWAFTECLFSPTSQPPFRMAMGTQTLGVTAVHGGILCMDCRFILSSTTLVTAAKTNGNLTTNTGLVDFDPNTKDSRLGTEGLRLRTIRFVRGEVIANDSPTGATTDNVVLHLIPTANGTNAAASTSPWMSVDDFIFDGTYLEWTLNRINLPTAGPWAHGVSAFTCTAATNVSFVNNCRTKVNLNGTVVAGYDQMNGYITDDAAYGFGTGAVPVPVGGGGAICIGTDGRLNVEGLTCEGWVQGAAVADVRLHVEDIRVKKWLNKYVAHAGLKRPLDRFLVTSPSFTAHGVVEDLEFAGTTAVANDWFAGSGGALIGVSQYQTGQGAPPLRFVRPTGQGFRDSGGTTTGIAGIRIEDGTFSGASTGLILAGAVDNVVVEKGFFEHTGYGVLVEVAPGNSIGNIIVDGAFITNCVNEGVLMQGSGGAAVFAVKTPEVRNCNIRTCGGLGISLIGDMSAEAVRVQDNHCRGNNGATGNAQILLTSTQATVKHYVHGNVTNGGKIQINRSGGGTGLTSPGDRTLGYYGSETGIAAIGAPPNNLFFTTTIAMLHNDATLLTP